VLVHVLRTRGGLDHYTTFKLTIDIYRETNSKEIALSLLFFILMLTAYNYKRRNNIKSQI
jgi:hypothetical protein